MTANSDKERADPQGSATDDHDEQTRRQFLGAAGAAAALPAIDTGDGETAKDEGQKEPQTPTWNESATVTTTAGGLELFNRGSSPTKVTITPHVDGVTLELRHPIGTINVLLLPEDIDKIRRQLAAAKAQLGEEGVKHTREWIGEYRDD